MQKNTEYKSPLQIFFFRTPLHNGEKSLFRNQLELTGALRDVGYDNVDQSYVSRVFRNKIYTPAPKMFEFLTKVIKKRLGKHSQLIQKEWIEKFGQIIASRNGNEIGDIPIKKIHLEAIGEQENPTQLMFVVLNRLELEAGFVFSKKTCSSILQDFVQNQAKS